MDLVWEVVRKPHLVAKWMRKESLAPRWMVVEPLTARQISEYLLLALDNVVITPLAIMVGGHFALSFERVLDEDIFLIGGLAIR